MSLFKLESKQDKLIDTDEQMKCNAIVLLRG